MSAFVAANLSVSAFNVILTLCVLVLMVARVPPPEVPGWALLGIFAYLEIGIWAGVFAFASA